MVRSLPAAKVRAQFSYGTCLRLSDASPQGTPRLQYLRFYLGISHEEWGHYYHDNWTEAGPEVGGGILWCPVRRVGLMVWQGVTVEESDRRNPIDRRYVSDRSTRTVRLQETRLLFLFRF